MKCSFLYILLFTFLAFQFIQAQEYVETQFFKEDGLPSDYCYNVIQDNEGFLWVPTEAGVVTFDGNNFQAANFPELNEKEIIQVFKDSWGRIWMVELSGEIFYIDEGELKQLNYPFIGTTYRFVSISDDQNGHIWLNDLHKPYAFGYDAENLELKYNFNSFQQQLDLLQSPGYLLHNKKVRLDGNNLFVTCQGVELLFKNFNIYKFYAKRTIDNNETQIFDYEDKLYTHDLKTGALNVYLQNFQSCFDKGIQNITQDNQGNLWIATKSGFYRIKAPLSEASQIDEYFADANSGFVTVDNQNNVWLSTTDQGMIKMSETSVTKITDKNSNNITRLVHLMGHLVYGTSKGEIVVLNKENQDVFRQKLEDRATIVYGLEILDDTNVIITTNKQISKFSLSTMSLSTVFVDGFFKSTSLSPNKKSLWLNGGQNNYFNPKIGGKIYEVSPQLRSYCSLAISDETAYIGSVNGLFKSNTNGSAEQILPSTIQVDVRSICKSHEGDLWIGTHGNGVYIINNDTLVHHIKNLPSKHIRDIVTDKHKMWIATNDGLCLVNKINQNYDVKVLDKGDGLASEQINSLFLYEDKIYIATKKGISIVDRDIEFEQEIPIVKINNVKINERDTSVFGTYKLESNQRNIKFDFGGILFNKPSSIQYKYMLSGLDSDWVFTKNATAQYPSLPPGQYSFLLQAKSINSRWSELKKVEFSISRKITEMLIFKILLAVAACVLLLLGFMFFSRSRRRSRDFKMSQMTALRAQMNPHFIFNSLNSVQDYILRDDKVAANKYISRFSKLMRYILNASEKEFTNLKKELDSLEVYMSIESMRFDNELKYSIEISDNLESEKYMIPTMILQPYIENAINHGLKHAEGEKKLFLRVKKYNAGLVIEIEDNGVGRIKSRSIKLESDNNYDSKGTQINQQRIELLNKHYQNKNKVTFKDVYDKDRNPTGTKVEIFLNSIKFS